MKLPASIGRCTPLANIDEDSPHRIASIVMERVRRNKSVRGGLMVFAVGSDVYASSSRSGIFSEISTDDALFLSLVIGLYDLDTRPSNLIEDIQTLVPTNLAGWVDKIGGTCAVAKMCGVAASTVSGWRVRKAPVKRQRMLHERFPDIVPAP